MNLTTRVKRAACFLAKWTDCQCQLQQLNDGTSNFVHPLALTASAPNAEVFYFKDAMHELDRDKFILAMMKEIKNLNEAQVWELEE